MRFPSSLVIVAAAALLSTGTLACGSGDNTPVLPSASHASSDPSSSGSTGTLSIDITDSPFSDAMALLVTFSEVSVHRADPGEWKTLPFVSGTSRTCDLKKLNGATDVLGVAPLAAGKYTQIRLMITSANLYFTNASVGGPCAAQIPPPGPGMPVEIPSGEVKLNNEFTLTSVGTKILHDFDGDQSVRQTGSGNGRGNGSANTKYMMSPVIRIVSVQ